MRGRANYRVARRAERRAPPREPPRAAHQPDADALGVLRVHRPGVPPERRLRPVEGPLPDRVPARRAGAASGRGSHHAHHRRGSEPALRAARGSAAAREHRDLDRQAPEPRARRSAGARRPPERAVLATAQAADHAARPLPPLDLRETASYVAGRLRIAGGNVSEFSRARPSSRFTSSRPGFPASSTCSATTR